MGISKETSIVGSCLKTLLTGKKLSDITGIAMLRVK
jgi:hypothetical protein